MSVFILFSLVTISNNPDIIGYRFKYVDHKNKKNKQLDEVHKEITQP